MVTWKLRDYLDRHGVSAHAFLKATDLAPSTVYALARGDQTRVDLGVLDKVIGGLEELTGRQIAFDLLAREAEEVEFPDGVPDDIRGRIRRLEAGETALRPWREVDTEQRAERGL